MAKKEEIICPACGCSVIGEGYVNQGVKYCCKACAVKSGPCECGCCSAEERKTTAKTK